MIGIQNLNAIECAIGNSEVLRIRPNRSWSFGDWVELWAYRDLLWTLAVRDLKLRYRQTALGVLWVLFQPLVGAGIFSVVFGKVAGLSGEGHSYFLYSLSGLLVWNAFQATLSKASVALIVNGSLVSKVYFPRLLLPLSTVLSTVVDFVIGFVAFCLVGALSGWIPSASIIQVPFWLLVSLILAIGNGLIAASLMTRFRDVQHVLPMALPFLMYATPVAYSMSAVPLIYKTIFELNPMAWVVQGMRGALLGGSGVPFLWCLYTVAVSGFLLLFGVISFRRMERSLVDVL